MKLHSTTIVSESSSHPICECWFLDVGQGTSNVILLGGGRAIVIDCGPRGSRETLAVLTRYVDTIEALIISHNDADHDYNTPRIMKFAHGLAGTIIRYSHLLHYGF